ncbi:MAG TPA: CHAT domain-containing protein, partial [Cyclobacteriaceae bacterium]|nr:CHAT domain-containing protein [Cyclobacteriaceae bacterium]
ESLQFDKARTSIEQVVITERQREGDHSPELAITLQHPATLNQKTGDLNAARKLLEEAMKIDAETMGNQSAGYATKMANLGVVQQQLGNLAEARNLFQQALQIHEKTLGKEHPDYMFNAYNLAVSLQQAKDPGAAAPLYKEVSGFYRKQIHELFPAMSEKEKAAFFNKINEVILAYMDFAVENGQKIPGLRGDLYDFRLSTKALLYNASVKIRNSILSSGDTLMLARFTEWQKAKEDLGILSQLTALERIQAEDEIQSLRVRINELEKFLSERSTSFNTETQQTSVDWRKVKAKLQKGQAAIEMIRLRLNLKNDSVIYAALIVRPEFETPEMVMLRNGREMESRDFFYYRNSIKFQLRNDRSYRVYWKPLEEKLAGVHTVFLSPDGVYNKINVMTLLDTRNEKYVLETTKIKLVNNTRELLNPVKPASNQLRAALFGRPDFNHGPKEMPTATGNRSPSDLEALVMNGVADLPGTEEEVNKINSLLRDQKWQSTTYLGDKTTEKAVKQQKDIRVLHIATHGFFIPVEGEKDPIMLSPDLRQPGKNPLLRSGLILSGTQRQQQGDAANRNSYEDGILTAYEVMNLNLDATELVILSACETGAGEIKNGEGIFGLQRAFLLAGAGNLVMSLWKVDDEATQELMVEFYRQWIVANDKYEAFHKTMLVMKSKMAEPFYWGGFAMVGIN